MPIDDEAGRISDPARRDEAGARTPELEEREWTERAFQLVFEIVGPCVNAWELAAVGGVRGTRSDGPIRTRVHVVPPEELRAGEAGETAARRLPHFLAGNEAVGLSPEPDLRKITEVPAVADDAVLARQGAGHHRGLARAGDRREHAAERHHETRLRQRGEGRRVGAHLGGREPDDVEDDERRQPSVSRAEATSRAMPRARAASSVGRSASGSTDHV